MFKRIDIKDVLVILIFLVVLLVLFYNFFVIREIKEMKMEIKHQNDEIRSISENLSILNEKLNSTEREMGKINRTLNILSKNLSYLNATLDKLSFSVKRKTFILGVEGGKGVAIFLETEVRYGNGRLLFNIDKGDIMLHYTVQRAMINAKKVAGKETNLSMEDFDIIFKLRGKGEKMCIVGESAGAAFTISMIAALENKKINESVGVTGVILPSGKIGMVTGIREKAKAAREIGIKLLLVPAGQEIDIEGIKTVGVSNIEEVENYMLY